MLRYLGDAEAAARLASLPQAEVSFNYLGQVDHTLPEPGLFVLTGETAGEVRAGENRRSHLLEVLGIVAAGRLRTHWSYSPTVHRPETVERLAAAFVAALRAVLAGMGRRGAAEAAAEPPPAPSARAEPSRPGIPLDAHTLELLREELGDLV
jgi:non-ribosomal peptide synthase protein (TIGR01720 family)